MAENVLFYLDLKYSDFENRIDFLNPLNNNKENPPIQRLENQFSEETAKPQAELSTAEDRRLPTLERAALKAGPTLFALSFGVFLRDCVDVLTCTAKSPATQRLS